MQGSWELGPRAHSLRALASTFLVEGHRPQELEGRSGECRGQQQ